MDYCFDGMRIDEKHDRRGPGGVRMDDAASKLFSVASNIYEKGFI